MSILASLRSLPMLLCVLAIIVTSPIRADRDSWMSIVLVAFWSLCIAGAALRLYPGKRWYAAYVGSALLILVAMCFLLIHNAPSKLWVNVGSVGAITIESLGIFLLLRHSFSRSSGSHTWDRLLSVIAAYFLLALLWESFYQMILTHDPGAFVDNVKGQPISESHLLYYSLVTQTTQGYGDIVPLTSLSRYTAAFQGAIGTIYLAVLVAVLMGTIQDERSGKS